MGVDQVGQGLHLIAEITVGAAREQGAWRPPVRFARLRLDTAVDVPAVDAALPG
ncbi:MAG: hypothetical protein WCD21_44975 [Streptomyces sp.]